MNGTEPDPARAGLFTVNETFLLIDANKAEFFHSMTAWLLFAAKEQDLISKLLLYICAPESKNQQLTALRSW